MLLWRLNNLTLPARVGLKLSTWRLESIAGLLLTHLTSAVCCSLRWRFRTFEVGILAMWMMENVLIYQDRFSVSGGIVSMSQMSRNLSLPRAEPVKRGLPTFSSLLSTVIWVKNCRSKKGLKQCLGGLKCSQNTKKNKKTLEVSFKAIFNVHFANLVSKEYFSIQRLIIFLPYE